MTYWSLDTDVLYGADAEAVYVCKGATAEDARLIVGILNRALDTVDAIEAMLTYRTSPTGGCLFCNFVDRHLSDCPAPAALAALALVRGEGVEA